MLKKEKLYFLQLFLITKDISSHFQIVIEIEEIYI